MNNRDSQHNPGHSSALKEIAEARNQAGRELALITTEKVDPNAVTYGGGSPVARAQALTFYYLDQIAPYRGGIPELWNERKLGTVHVPRERSEEATGDTSAQIKNQRFGPPEEQTTIEGLGDFNEWRHAMASFNEKSSGRRPSPKGRRAERIILPVSILQQAYDTMNDAAARLNLSADVPDSDIPSDHA